MLDMTIASARTQAALGIALLLLAAFALSPTTACAQDDRVQIVISPSDSITVHLEEPLCASRAAKGDAVTFSVARDVELSGHVVVEKGAPVTGEVVEVRGNGRGGKGGRLVVQLTEMVARDGARIALSPESGKLGRSGGNRGFFAKVFTFWLIKGGDPCFTTSDEFQVAAQQAVSVRVPRN